MEICVGIIVGVIITFIFMCFANIGDESEIINELSERRKENKELQDNLDNAELRATEFARKIKTIEDIILNGENNKENFFVIISKIKELVHDHQSKN